MKNNISFEPFQPSDTLILGFSGGADSVFLGEMLFRQKFQNVVVAHFNHNLREEESLRDEEFCRHKAGEWRYTFERDIWQQPKESEEKARTDRYDFFASVQKKHNAKAILLAHHADDQVETIFFQFLRGTGIRGLRGMKKWNERRKIFRPLLGITKNKILAFLKKENISYCTDSTNADAEKFDRNFLRLQILPPLMKRFPHLCTSLLRNAEHFVSLEQFIAEVVVRTLQKLGKNHTPDGIPQEFSRDEFFVLPEFLQSEILRKLCAPQTPSADQIYEILEFLRTAKSGKKKSLLGITFEVYGKNVFLSNSRSKNSFQKFL